MGKAEATSLLSEANSSVGVTNSTIDDSCAGFDLDVSFSGTLSDLNSGDNGLHSGVYDDMEEEPEPLSADLLKEYAALGDVTEESTYQINDNDSTKPPRYNYDSISSKRRPNNMLEWMMELQSSAEEAYITAKANEEIMKKSMR
ncbi:Hypothetical protein PHPALM_11296 [Phytophthora palmivora]|uniref:Uncharacterized protein n=1 Tax=Phytophthora palmivora TaxID=4796 RepID=A0A2P4Y2K7_9STRA|nr:Hypothetical protein PHPALM_11296 [Phytophthora palmivora]